MNRLLTTSMLLLGLLASGPSHAEGSCGGVPPLAAVQDLEKALDASAGTAGDVKQLADWKAKTAKLSGEDAFYTVIGLGQAPWGMSSPSHDAMPRTVTVPAAVVKDTQTLYDKTEPEDDTPYEDTHEHGGAYTRDGARGVVFEEGEPGTASGWDSSSVRASAKKAQQTILLMMHTHPRVPDTDADGNAIRRQPPPSPSDLHYLGQPDIAAILVRTRDKLYLVAPSMESQIEEGARGSGAGSLGIELEKEMRHAKGMFEWAAPDASATETTLGALSVIAQEHGFTVYVGDVEEDAAGATLPVELVPIPEEQRPESDHGEEGASPLDGFFRLFRKRP